MGFRRASASLCLSRGGASIKEQNLLNLMDSLQLLGSLRVLWLFSVLINARSKLNHRAMSHATHLSEFSVAWSVSLPLEESRGLFTVAVV